jgi:cytochrome o ubiquinol oxidase subunit 3
MSDHAAVHHEITDRNTFGFWVYLMTDCMLFACLFAAYAVLHPNTFGGPSGKDLFELPFVLAETLILLTSTFTSGMGTLAAQEHSKKKFLFWYGITFLLGASFVALELYEFSHLVSEGFSWRRSGFLTSFFSLVGTHGTHVSFGLIWMLVMMFQVGFRGFTHHTLRRQTCLKLFWHFLDLVWIFIFTFVYLMGAK